MNLDPLPLTLEASVRLEYLDSLDHMNVMWYTHHFDMATWAFYEGFGFGRDYHQLGNGSFALEQHTRYLAELRVDESFRIYTRALGRSEKLFHFMHFMQRAGDNELSATSELLGIHVDMGTRRGTAMPEAIAAAWDALIAEHNQLDWDAPLSGTMAP